jgi:hypothetical protein
LPENCAAPLIRRALIDAAEMKLNARTKRDEQKHLGQMFAYAQSLGILLRSPVGAGEPRGVAPGVGSERSRAVAEAKRFLGGSARWAELGFDA